MPASPTLKKFSTGNYQHEGLKSPNQKVSVQFSLNSLKSNNSPSSSIQIKGGITNINQRQNRQNISPKSDCSAVSNNKSNKSQNSKISVNKKIISPNNKSTKSAKNGAASPAYKPTTKKTVFPVNLERREKKIEGPISDLSIEDSPTWKLQMAVSPSPKPNHTGSKSSTSIKHYPSQSKQTQVGKKDTRNVSPNDTDLKSSAKLSESPCISSSHSGYTFITKKQGEILKPTTVKYSGTTVYKGGLMKS